MAGDTAPPLSLASGESAKERLYDPPLRPRRRMPKIAHEQCDTCVRSLALSVPLSLPQTYVVSDFLTPISVHFEPPMSPGLAHMKSKVVSWRYTASGSAPARRRSKRIARPLASSVCE